jgi:hypothetical protein
MNTQQPERRRRRKSADAPRNSSSVLSPVHTPRIPFTARVPSITQGPRNVAT